MNEKEVIEKLYKNRHNLIVDGDIGCGKKYLPNVFHFYQE